MTQTTLAKLRRQVRLHEGFVPNPYRDSKGNWTAGVGHLIREGDPPVNHECWRDATFLEELYEKDLLTHLEEAKGFVGLDAWNALPEEAQLVVADMTFNMGGSKMARWTRFQAAIRNHDWSRAVDSMCGSAWFGQVGQRGRNLVKLMKKLYEQ